MNLAKLKAYAPRARQEFLLVVTDRAAYYGIKQEGASVSVLPMTEKGDGVVIDGKAFPRKVGAQRKALEERVRTHGFEQTMEALAYTWFNRLVAIRFMETHGYLDHGYRVLSPAPHHRDGRGERLPELLEQAEHVSLPGLSQQTVIDLKIDGTKDAQLYRLLLIAQCNALHSTMPFIFPKLDDETELLLPDNLLHSDSLIRNLTREISDEDCASVELLGWLYQFYISEKKDAVIARKSAVPMEDTPAITQLFTPHWIVRYLVENSLGRLWMLNRPGSRLREQMPYYIDGEAETDFLKVARPEDIQVLDPAVGSGHMLIYAFDLLYAIYVEEGYVPSDVPALILENNLCGLDICPRAAQLAALALVLKAREKSRRFFQSGKAVLVQPRIIPLQDVRFEEGELREYMRVLNLGEVFDEPMLGLLQQFERITTFGSLIQPCVDERVIALARSALEKKDLGEQLFLRATHLKVLRVLEQAGALARHYHVIVANPPYLSSRKMNPALKRFIEDTFRDYKSDLFAAFLVRCLEALLPGGQLGAMSPFVWMFLPSHEALRRLILQSHALTMLAHPEYHSFFESAYVPISAFIVAKRQPHGTAVFIRLTEFYGADLQPIKTLEAIADPGVSWRYDVKPDAFLIIPGAPIAYWASARVRSLFTEFRPLRESAEPVRGVETGDNERFLRNWHEIDRSKLGIGCKSADMTLGKKWFPYNKGGGFAKWDGYRSLVIDWGDNGHNIKSQYYAPGTRLPWRAAGSHKYFADGITWGGLTSSVVSFRYSSHGAIFDSNKGAMMFPGPDLMFYLLGFLNSNICDLLLSILNPTLSTQNDDVGALPLCRSPNDSMKLTIEANVGSCIAVACADWDSFETSWDFSGHPLLRPDTKGITLAESWKSWRDQCAAAVRRMQELETENNRLFIAAYGLEGELTANVDQRQITLSCNPAFRFKKKRKKKDESDYDAVVEAGEDDLSYSDEEQSKLFLAQTAREFLSYAVGCMMGRYSLDQPGLILADAGDTLAAYRAKVGRPRDSLTFAPDEDGIIPVLDDEWFTDDIVARARDFLRATFGESTLEANLRFIEDALDKDLRKYFLSDFYKDHRQTYKKRPIYWPFSSGKQRAFQCLVYMHRYNEGTLSRMRTEYVVPLQGQLASRIEQLEDDKARATSTSHRRKLQKEQDLLKRQQAELLNFDEKLKHAAGQKIRLDLDDGVKVNYGKFGDLLADVDAVTGGADE